MLRKPLEVGKLEDWGPVPTMIEGQSHTAGVYLYPGREGDSECGIWECTPGYWNCLVDRDEFCHFLEGRCTYTHEDGTRDRDRARHDRVLPGGLEGHLPRARDGP